MKAFRTLSPTSKLPSINQELRSLGLSQNDIDTFWDSDIELIFWKTSWNNDQKRIHADYEAEMGPDNPDIDKGDDFWTDEYHMVD